jgi:hypothetical protein
MFDRETWRQQIAERVNNFARNPRQEIQIAGVSTVLGFLALRTLEPFLIAFHEEPVAAVLTLADISRGPGANHIVRRAGHWRYQVSHLIERELRSRPELRLTIEEILLTLNVIHLARQRLNSSRDEWLRLTLLAELDTLRAVILNSYVVNCKTPVGRAVTKQFVACACAKVTIPLLILSASRWSE